MQELTNDKTIKILLVEDDDLIVKVHSKMLVKILSTTNYLIDIAKNVEEALKLFLLTNSYSLIITDIGLPDISGIELVNTIRQLEAGNKKTPIIAISGFTEEIKKQCLEAGADNVYSKPIKLEALNEAIRKYIRII